MNAWAYCERLDARFWAEPFNATTNLAFFLAALAAWNLWWRHDRGDRPVLALIALVLMIGIGSFLFHTMPAPWSARADVIPIQLFAFGYFVLAMRRFLGLGAIAAAAATAAFVIASFGLQRWLAPLLPPGTARGSAAYASFLLALFATAWLVRARTRENAISNVGARGLGGYGAACALALAGVLFAISLTLRSIDQAVCTAMPIGTHFLWHLLNAAVVFILLRAAMSSGPRAGQ
jgi:Ceramidase